VGDRQQVSVNGGEETPSSSGAALAGNVTSATSEVLIKPGPEFRPEVATELLRAEAGDITAETVTMERAGAEHITAQRLVMTNSGARTLEARSAQVDRSGILVVQSEKAVFTNSTAVAVATEETRIVRSRVAALKTEHATFEGDTRIAVYAGPLPEGVRPLVDSRGAAACGAALGGVLLLLGALLRRLLRAS
jgi:hypothetical protein